MRSPSEAATLPDDLMLSIRPRPNNSPRRRTGNPLRRASERARQKPGVWYGVAFSLTLFCVGQAEGIPRTGAADLAPPLREAGFSLTLANLRELVRTNSDSVQMAMLEAEVNHRLQVAEGGLFEPQFVGSVDHMDTRRPNNAEQLANLGFFATPVYAEQNTLYNGALEFLSPIGSRLRTGAALRELNNTVQQGFGPEYESFVGITLTQPLLRNFGTTATLAKLRLAAMASGAAFQQYRKALMLGIAQAEAAYWDLYLAQERERIDAESLELGERLLTDTRARFEVGASSQLEVLQAEAGVSLRQARFNDARQRVSETAVRLRNFLGGTTANRAALPRAVDAPDLVAEEASPQDNYWSARSKNPDYLLREIELGSEGIRTRYAKNQRLPTLDLKAAYGLNGLGLTPGESWSDLTADNHAAWSVGFEVRVPITGGIRERNEYRAAIAAREKALAGVREALTQLFNGVDRSRRRLQLHRDNVRNYDSVAAFHERLLESQIDRLHEGVVDNRTVLETEERLSDARVSVVEGLVAYRRALLELEMVRGSLLEDRQMESTQEELASRTQTLLASARLSPEALSVLQRRAVAELVPGPDSTF